MDRSSDALEDHLRRFAGRCASQCVRSNERQCPSRRRPVKSSRLRVRRGASSRDDEVGRPGVRTIFWGAGKILDLAPDLTVQRVRRRQELCGDRGVAAATLPSAISPTKPGAQSPLTAAQRCRAASPPALTKAGAYATWPPPCPPSPSYPQPCPGPAPRYRQEISGCTSQSSMAGEHRCISVAPGHNPLEAGPRPHVEVSDRRAGDRDVANALRDPRRRAGRHRR